MDRQDQYREHSIVLFAAGVLALNYPLLAIADRVLLLLGIPLLYFFIFLVWLAMIVVMACIASRAEINDTGSD